MKRRAWRPGMVRAAALVSLVAGGLIVSSAGAATGSPSAPRAVHASGTATSVSVKWSRPASTGSSPIREYVVRSKPLGRSCSTKATSCVVRGLKASSSYTFSVVAENSHGASAPSTSNRIRVAKAGTYFRDELGTFSHAAVTAETEFENPQTTAKGETALKKLTSSFIASLKLERWPSGASSNMASFIGDTRQLVTDTITALGASATDAAQDNDTLQGATIKNQLAEAQVYANLGLPSPIKPPITTVPTAVALNTAQTIHDLYGDAVSVTATQVIDPATGASASAESGDRFVAVELTLSNQSSATSIDGDANYSTTLTGSDGQTYAADYDMVSQCTSFLSGFGDFQLSSGASSTGCVVFQLPTAVSVQSIQFTLAPNYLDTAEWNS